MVNAQEWLDKEYPHEKRNEITQIFARNKNLEGKLVIKDFAKLAKLEVRGNNLTNVELSNLPSLTDFNANLCQLSTITVQDCPQIIYFNVANNLLTNSNFLNGLNPEKLTFLAIHSNNFPEQDLSFLSKFISLENLFIGNYSREKFEKGIYNRFTGSLEPLVFLNKLKELLIENTDISNGLGYLASSVQRIYCSADLGGESGCQNTIKQLEIYHQKDEKGNFYNYQNWRKANPALIELGNNQRTKRWLDQNCPPSKEKIFRFSIFKKKV